MYKQQNTLRAIRLHERNSGECDNNSSSTDVLCPSAYRHVILITAPKHKADSLTNRYGKRSLNFYQKISIFSSIEQY
jgi:hypothetical protein